MFAFVVVLRVIENYTSDIKGEVMKRASIIILTLILAGLIVYTTRANEVFLRCFGVDVRPVKSLSEKEITRYLEENKLKYISSINIDGKTILLFDENQDIRISRLSVNDLGKIFESGGQSVQKDNDVNFGIQGYGVDGNKYSFMYLYINNKTLQKESFGLEVNLNGNETINIVLKGKEGIVLQLPENKINEMPQGIKILDKSGAILYEMIKNGTTLEYKKYY